MNPPAPWSTLIQCHNDCSTLTAVARLFAVAVRVSPLLTLLSLRSRHSHLHSAFPSQRLATPDRMACHFCCFRDSMYCLLRWKASPGHYVHFSLTEIEFDLKINRDHWVLWFCCKFKFEHYGRPFAPGRAQPWIVNFLRSIFSKRAGDWKLYLKLLVVTALCNSLFVLLWQPVPACEDVET